MSDEQITELREALERFSKADAIELNHRELYFFAVSLGRLCVLHLPGILARLEKAEKELRKH